MEYRLIYFLPADVGTEGVYNPSEIPAFRSTLSSSWADELDIREPAVVLLRRLGPDRYEVIRRTGWPMSQNDFAALISEGNGNGEGSQASPVNLFDKDFSFGAPIGFNPGRTAALFVLLVIAAMIIIDR